MSEDWYDTEESTRIGLVVELQRIVRRTRARPLRVIALAALLVGAVGWKLAHKKASYQAEVVLSLNEESMSVHKTNIPVEELKDYVWTVLMSDNKLAEIVEKRDLHKLRKTFGVQYGVEQLRGQIDIAIWKNSFIEFKDEEANGLSSARIGITVTDGSNTQAFTIARDVADVIIKTAEKQNQDIADKVAAEVKTERTDLVKRLDGLAAQIADLEVEKLEAATKPGVRAAIELELTNLARQQKGANNQLLVLSSSRGAIADRITAAGLDMTITTVDERRPEVAVHSTFILILILTVVGVFALIGSMLVVGAFDPRVHDSEDVLRLGLPMLGHVPGFPGDHVASLRARGAARRRVPSFLRWRSHR
jgi:capsular polysaccharide biosynthesis protein